MMFFMKTVFVAMSGGIDSSYAAYLLTGMGYRVVGCTFALLPGGMTNPKNPKACCSAETIGRARRVADRLGISHYVMNLRDAFEEHVIARFIDEYRAGRTPNPCVLCNRHIKFSIFLERARALGADLVATGHYARVDKNGGGYALKKGVDRTKDQSYFLWPLPKETLPAILFPLGDSTKSQTRDEASLFGDFRQVRESQEICFIPNDDYRAFISQFVPPKKGPILFADGRQIGIHHGVHCFTIGQRRGLNIPFGEPLYVLSINPADNTVVAGPKECLARRGLVANDLNLISAPCGGPLAARVRYRQKDAPCTISVSDETMEVIFDEPVLSITPGQSVVVYEGDTVVGGGIIERSF